MPALLTISYIFYIRSDLWGSVSWWNGALALLGAVIFQVGGNLLNDYFDFTYKVDRVDTHSSRILVDGIFTPRSIFIFGVCSLLVGSLIGFMLYISSGMVVIYIGIVGFLGAFFYNHLKYIALGDLVIFLIYGLLIGLGVSVVMTNQLLWEVLLVNASLGLLIVAILHANNTRDIVNDKQAKIKTQAMLLGVKSSKIYFMCLLTGAYIILILNVALGFLHPLCLLVFATFPISLKLIRQMQRVDINNLEEIKYLTESVAKLVLLYGVLLSLANFIAGFIH